MMEDDKTKLTWNLPRVLLPKNRVKLLLNLLLLAAGTIPRGGSLSVEPIGEGDAMGFRITATGTECPHAAGGARRCVAGETGENAVDAHAIQPFYTGLLARTCGMTVDACAGGRSDRADRPVDRLGRLPAARRAGVNRLQIKRNCRVVGPRSVVIFPFGPRPATNP